MFLRFAALFMAVILVCAPVAFAQVPTMPGPSGTLINAQAATTTSTAFSISGYGVTTFQTFTVASSLQGTVAYQGSMDNVNWTPLVCWNNGTTTAASTTAVSSTQANVFVECNTDAIPLVRAVLSPWVAGTWTVNVGASYMPRTK